MGTVIFQLMNMQCIKIGSQKDQLRFSQNFPLQNRHKIFTKIVMEKQTSQVNMLKVIIRTKNRLNFRKINACFAILSH